jgi:hypothetical protein
MVPFNSECEDLLMVIVKNAFEILAYGDLKL